MMSFEEIWMEVEESHPMTDDQRYYILDLLDSAKQNDEQRRYWMNKIQDATFDEAQKVIEELKAISKLLDHPNFGGGGMTFKDWKKEAKEILGE